jgi:hypothetical protein
MVSTVPTFLTVSHLHPTNPTTGTPCKSRYFTYASAIPTLAFPKSCTSCEPANPTPTVCICIFRKSGASLRPHASPYPLNPKEKTPRTQGALSSPQDFILLAPYMFSPLQSRFPNPGGYASPVKILTASTAGRRLRSIQSP